MKILPFFKMHGAGNDYIYINGFEHTVENPHEAAKIISDRHFGVGGDGIILIEPSTRADAKMRMYNADGSEGEMCGNGVRCIGKFLYEREICRKEVIELETLGGIKELYLNIRGGRVDTVRVNMGRPSLAAAEIPCTFTSSPVINQPIKTSEITFTCTAVSMGNPHAVIFTDEVLSDKLVLGYGSQLELNEVFPNRTNVEFVNIINRNEVRARVWERGSGETLACGTGACAIVVAGVLGNRLDRNVVVHLPGGDLEIEYDERELVWKTGPAEFVFEGHVPVSW